MGSINIGDFHVSVPVDISSARNGQPAKRAADVTRRGKVHKAIAVVDAPNQQAGAKVFRGFRQ